MAPIKIFFFFYKKRDTLKSKNRQFFNFPFIKKNQLLGWGRNSGPACIPRRAASAPAWDCTGKLQDRPSKCAADPIDFPGLNGGPINFQKMYYTQFWPNLRPKCNPSPILSLDEESRPIMPARTEQGTASVRPVACVDVHVTRAGSTPTRSDPIEDLRYGNQCKSNCHEYSPKFAMIGSELKIITNIGDCMHTYNHVCICISHETCLFGLLKKKRGVLIAVKLLFVRVCTVLKKRKQWWCTGMKTN